MDSTARAVWDGGLVDGEGTTTLSSGAAGALPVSWQARAEESGGQTSPEELIAAAHATCYCMALSNGLTEAGATAIHLEAEATVTFVPGTGVTKSALHLRGHADGIDDAGFLAAAEAAKSGCPVSAALAGNVEITLDVRPG